VAGVRPPHTPKIGNFPNFREVLIMEYTHLGNTHDRD
jgi:hypothetical protein